MAPLPAGEGLRWLAGILWGPRLGLRAGVRRGGSSAGELETYIVIPSAARPRFLLPAASMRAAAGSLLAFNALRPPATRAARRLVAAGLPSGLSGRLFPDRLAVHRLPDAEGQTLTGHLRDVLGRGDLVAAMGVGGPGPNRKPVLHLFSEEGEPVGFAKVGWNQITARRIANEGEALERWPVSSELVRAPAILYRGEWRGLKLLVTAPLPASVRRPPRPSLPPAVAYGLEVATVQGAEPETLGTGRYGAELRRRLDQAASSGQAGVAEALAPLREALSGVWADVELRSGAWHGDWAPWNFAWEGRRLWVFDWEHWRRPAPVGLDEVHFGFQVAFVLRRRSVGEAMRAARAAALPRLAALGVTGAAAEVLPALHLAEVFLRTHEAMLEGVAPGARFYPAVLPELARIGR